MYPGLIYFTVIYSWISGSSLTSKFEGFPLCEAAAVTTPHASVKDKDAPRCSVAGEETEQQGAHMAMPAHASHTQKLEMTFLHAPAIVSSMILILIIENRTSTGLGVWLRLRSFWSQLWHQLAVSKSHSMPASVNNELALMTSRAPSGLDSPFSNGYFLSKSSSQTW